MRGIGEITNRLRELRFRVTRRLPDHQPEEMWPGIERTQLRVSPFAYRYGNTSLYEMMVICSVAKHLDAKNLFEFGTFDGLTTWHLAANCGPDSRILTLDLPADHPARQAEKYVQGVLVGSRFIGTSEAERITQLYGDSQEFDPGPYLRKVDFSFIDASHEYEHVRRDTENALAMTRPGGAILWHDYSAWFPGVQKCLDDLAAQLPVFRVESTALAATVVQT